MGYWLSFQDCGCSQRKGSWTPASSAFAPTPKWGSVYPKYETLEFSTSSLLSLRAAKVVCACMCVHVHVHTCTCAWMYVHVWVCILVGVSVCMCVCVWWQGVCIRGAQGASTWPVTSAFPMSTSPLGKDSVRSALLEPGVKEHLYLWRRWTKGQRGVWTNKSSWVSFSFLPHLAHMLCSALPFHSSPLSSRPGRDTLRLSHCFGSSFP